MTGSSGHHPTLERTSQTIYKVVRVQVISQGLGFRAREPAPSHLSIRSTKLQSGSLNPGLTASPRGTSRKGQPQRMGLLEAQAVKLAFPDSALTPVSCPGSGTSSSLGSTGTIQDLTVSSPTQQKAAAKQKTHFL